MATIEQLQALADRLEEEFYQAEVSEGEVRVTHRNDYMMRIDPHYSYDGVRECLVAYACELVSPEGELAEAEYSDVDELRAALEQQENIDPDANVKAFVQQVSDLFGSNVWRLGTSLDDVVDGWEPVDFDEDRYRGRVDAMAIRQAHLGAYGEVEAVEMVALGDFHGEEAEELWGENLAGQVAAWLEDTVDSHQPDEED